MKNLKKIAALVIVLALALSTVSFAFTDVAEDASYNEAVEVMADLGLLKGYEDGSFGPDKTITRAEFAAVVVRMLGMEDQAAGASANTIFNDVPANEWYAGYVQIANQRGIIAGYGDGNFGPNDEVLYEQAVKMIVCALGYAPKFENVPNAYPTSYLAQANTSEITVGAAGKIGDKATRAIVARLAYNALDVKLMDQTSFGKDYEYATIEGTLLSDYLKIAKVEANVSAKYFDAKKADKVQLEVTDSDDIYAKIDNDFKVTYDSDKKQYVYPKNDFYFADGVELKKGYTSVAYIDVSDDDYTVLSMVPKAGENNTLTLTATQVKNGDLDFSGKALYYYENSYDVDSDTEDVELDANVQVFVNENAKAETKDATFEKNFEAGKYKEITLIDNNDDLEYDYIFVTDYYSFVVDTINERSYKLSGDYYYGDDDVKLDPEDEKSLFSIRNANGEDIAFADIKVGDVVNVFKSVDGSNAFYDVIVSDGKVTGTISEVNDDVYVIDGVEYRSAGKKFEAGEAGVFTVDLYNMIVKYEMDGGNRKFGIAYKTFVDDDGVETAAKVMMYTAEGAYETYGFATNVKVASLNSGKYNNIETVASSKFVNAGKIDTTYLAADASKAEIAMYVVNSSNLITEIYMTVDAIAARDSQYKAATASKDAYRESNGKIASYYVTEATKLIAGDAATLVNNDKANYAAATTSIFVDDDGETTYDFTGICDSNKDLVFAVVLGAAPKADKTSKPLYVTSVGTTTDSEGSTAQSVTGYVDGEKVNIVVTGDAKFYAIDGTDPKDSDIAVGDVIQYVPAEEVVSVRYIINANDYQDYIDGKAAKVGATEDAKGDGFLTYGKLKEYRSGTATIGSTDYTFRTGCAGMLVRDVKTVDSKVVAGRVFASDIDISIAERDDDFATDNDDIVIMYKYDDEEVAVVILDTKKDTTL